jgi:hypothetical protein
VDVTVLALLGAFLVFSLFPLQVMRPAVSYVVSDDPPLRRAFAGMERTMDQYVAQASLLQSHLLEAIHGSPILPGCTRERS